MQITRSTIETQKGPAAWFTGDVYIDAVAAPAGTSAGAAAAVHFTPGARTARHRAASSCTSRCSRTMRAEAP
jgi:quercetin dioxygenase-like cupin family protein